MRIAVLLRVDAPLRPTGRRRRRIDCSRRFDAKRRKPSQHAETQGISATRWRRPLPEGRNRAKTTPKRFMDETSRADRSEEHTSELQSLMRISYAVYCFKQKNKKVTKA